MVKRNRRNHIIEGFRKKNEVTSAEAAFMFTVRDMLGEDDVIDLDLDEIGDATGMNEPEEMEELLDLMHDLGIVDVSYEDQSISEPME
jgi:hypothetical protein